MDGRKNNGNKGHSTKAKGVDRRKNEYKTALDKAGSVDSVSKVLKMLHKKATEDFDTSAAKIYLEYYLGRPTQPIDMDVVAEIEISFED